MHDGLHMKAILSSIRSFAVEFGTRSASRGSSYTGRAEHKHKRTFGQELSCKPAQDELSSLCTHAAGAVPVAGPRECCSAHAKWHHNCRGNRWYVKRVMMDSRLIVLTLAEHITISDSPDIVDIIDLHAGATSQHAGRQLSGDIRCRLSKRLQSLWYFRGWGPVWRRSPAEQLPAALVPSAQFAAHLATDGKFLRCLRRGILQRCSYASVNPRHRRRCRQPTYVVLT